MITIATLLWEPNRHSQSFSRIYSEAWVDKLYRGFQRNLTQPFRFICYVDKPRRFKEDIGQRQIVSHEPGYGDCIQPYEMGVAMILVGLDTVITGNVDHLANYALTGDTIALPRDPYAPERACNGVALVPAGNDNIWTNWRGENDMEWMRMFPHRFIDDVFPGHVQSFKGAVRDRGIGDTRITYFHGAEKPHELPRGHEILEHWR